MGYPGVGELARKTVFKTKMFILFEEAKYSPK